jgi:hypothetical protein
VWRDSPRLADDEHSVSPVACVDLGRKMLRLQMPGRGAEESVRLFLVSTIRSRRERVVAVPGDANELTARRSTAARSASQLPHFLQFRAANAAGEANEGSHQQMLHCGRKWLLAPSELLFEG